MYLGNSKRILLAVVLVTAAMTTSVSATLVGDIVTGHFGSFSALPGDPDNRFFTGNATVLDPGVEFTGTTGQDDIITADFDGDSLLISFNHLGNHPPTGHSYGGFGMAFADLDWVGVTGRIIGLNPDPTNTLAISNFSFTDDTLDIDFINLQFPAGNVTQTARFDIIKTHAGVPEPTTAMLGLLVLGGLGVMTRRRHA